jgi:cytoskeletal protein RodZ
MTVEELGKALSAARTARGLSIADVERDTRISSKYLKALEAGELEVLPAPVYARAFTRTYAQYLGLNAPQLVQQLPGAKPEAELPPLPDVARSTSPLLTPSWVVAGVVVVLLLVVGLALFWSRGGDGETQVSNQPPDSEESSGVGAENVPPPDGASTSPVVEAGIVPDLEAQQGQAAVSALSEAGLPYVVIEVDSDDAPEGTVLSQSPSPGSPTEDGTVVTLLVSR